MTKYPMTKEVRMTNEAEWYGGKKQSSETTQATNGINREWPLPPPPPSSLGLRHFFGIGYFVIRH